MEPCTSLAEGDIYANKPSNYKCRMSFEAAQLTTKLTEIDIRPDIGFICEASCTVPMTRSWSPYIGNGRAKDSVFTDTLCTLTSMELDLFSGYDQVSMIIISWIVCLPESGGVLVLLRRWLIRRQERRLTLLRCGRDRSKRRRCIAGTCIRVEL